MPACFSMISCIAWDDAFEVSQEKRLLLVGRAGVSVMVATVFSNMKSYCCKRSILLSTWNECRGTHITCDLECWVNTNVLNLSALFFPSLWKSFDINAVSLLFSRCRCLAKALGVSRT